MMPTEFLQDFPCILIPYIHNTVFRAAHDEIIVSKAWSYKVLGRVLMAFEFTYWSHLYEGEEVDEWTHIIVNYPSYHPDIP